MYRCLCVIHMKHSSSCVIRYLLISQNLAATPLHTPLHTPDRMWTVLHTVLCITQVELCYTLCYTLCSSAVYTRDGGFGFLADFPTNEYEGSGNALGPQSHPTNPSQHNLSITCSQQWATSTGVYKQDAHAERGSYTAVSSRM